MESKYTMELPDYGDVMSASAWLESCEAGLFIDYDGHGHPAKDGKMDESIVLKPSQRQDLPKDATHVVWFNK